MLLIGGQQQEHSQNDRTAVLDKLNKSEWRHVMAGHIRASYSHLLATAFTEKDQPGRLQMIGD